MGTGIISRSFGQVVWTGVVCVVIAIAGLLTMGCSEANPVDPYEKGDIVKVTWETTGGGDILFDIVREESSFSIHVTRYQFGAVDETIALTAADEEVYNLVNTIFNKQRNLYDDTFEPGGPTGTWTSVTLHFFEVDPLEIENIKAWEDLGAIYQYVTDRLD